MVGILRGLGCALIPMLLGACTAPASEALRLQGEVQRLQGEAERLQSEVNRLQNENDRLFEQAEEARLDAAERAVDRALRADKTATTEPEQATATGPGSLQINSNKPAEVWSDRRRLGNTPLTVELEAGTHIVELRCTVCDPQERHVFAVTIDAGERSYQNYTFK